MNAIQAINGFFLKTISLPLILYIFLCAFSGPAGAQIHAGQHYARIDSIIISGNKITREPVILREILFAKGDFVAINHIDSLIARSKVNLINTSLFNFVEIDKSFTDPDSAGLSVTVRVTERWYIWPTLIMKLSDRNFNVWWQTKDFSRLSYGFYIDWQNFRGRKEDLILKMQWGYNRVIQLNYLIPYLDRRKIFGLEFGIGYSRQKETAYQTMYNKQEFFKEPGEGFARRSYHASGKMIYRRNIHNTHSLELSYDLQHFSDSLVSENKYFTVDSSDVVQYISLNYIFKSDHRDNKAYPLNGYYADFSLVKHGLWTFDRNTLNTANITATYRKFWELHPRVFFATGINGMVSAGYQPYFILGGIGYDRDIVRSYEYYLVDAQHFCISKNNVKFALIPTQVKKISFIRTDKFSKIFYALYMNVFFDAGLSYYNQDFGKVTNDLQNVLLLGYGTGFDLVTYYDVVVRLEFSVNFKNETGIFLHFRAPI